MISAYAQIAEKLGYGITEEDIREAVKQEEASRKAKTDKVVSDMEELEDDDVENVAGGMYPDILSKCGEVMQEIFDICWKNDVCSIHIN